MIVLMNIITRNTWSNLVSLLFSRRNSRTICHLMFILTTIKAIPRYQLDIPHSAYSSSDTSRLTTLRTTTLLRFDLSITRSILSLSPILEPRLVLLTWSNPLHIFCDPLKFGLLYGFIIHHKPGQSHIIREHGRTKYSFHKVGNIGHKPTHLIPRVVH